MRWYYVTLKQLITGKPLVPDILEAQIIKLLNEEGIARIPQDLQLQGM